HALHPHVGGIAGGIGIREDGSLVDDHVDRLGHGTAVTAAIREKVPDAEIFAIKVFWQTLATEIRSLTRAIDLAAERDAHLINLSLGTAEMEHRRRLEGVITTCRHTGSIVVAAHDDNRTRWPPGRLDQGIGGKADWTRHRHG